MNSHLNLQEYFGNLDIYLFDQLLKNRFTPPMRVLNAGCESGRNFVRDDPVLDSKLKEQQHFYNWTRPHGAHGGKSSSGIVISSV